MLNLEGRIGGDAELSHRGEEYARKLPQLVRESVGVSSFFFIALCCFWSTLFRFIPPNRVPPSIAKQCRRRLSAASSLA
jgi:hypothetical protein